MMTIEEQMQLSSIIDASWPKRFNENDLKFWCRKLAPLPYKAVIEALSEHKANSDKRPMLKTIMVAVAGPGASAAAAPTSSRAGDSITIAAIRTQFIQRGRALAARMTPAEIYCHYLRAWYLETNMVSQGAAVAARAMHDEPAGNIAAANVRQAARMKQLRADGVINFQSECGMNLEQAEYTTDMSLAPLDSDFRQALAYAQQFGNVAEPAASSDGESGSLY